MSREEQLSRLVTYEQYKEVDSDLDKIYKLMKKEFKHSKRPDSFVQRAFTDIFGVFILYITFFFLCDFTRSVLLRSDFYGIKWLFFGPYYFFTGAPLMTRMWRSKKFLEDLSEFRGSELNWPDNRSCTQASNDYVTDCNSHERNPHHHPIREKLGGGLDWLITHFLRKSGLGSMLGNSTCEQQGNTVTEQCSNDRVKALWDCYLFFTSVNDVPRVADNINNPTIAGGLPSQTIHWDQRSYMAYEIYYNAYWTIYDLNNTLLASHPFTPTHYNPNFDSTNNYCYDALVLFMGGLFVPPNWFIQGGGYHQPVCYYQQNYKSHQLDYWD